MRFYYITYLLISCNLIISFSFDGFASDKNIKAYNYLISNDTFLVDERLLLTFLESSCIVDNSFDVSSCRTVFKLIHRIVNRPNSNDLKLGKLLPILDKDFLIFKLLKIYHVELSNLASNRNWQLYNEITDDFLTFLSSYSNTRETYQKIFLENLIIISTQTHLPTETCAIIKKQIFRNYKKSLKVALARGEEKNQNEFFNLNTILAFWLICINDTDIGKAELSNFCKNNQLDIQFSLDSERFYFHCPELEASCGILADYKIDFNVKNRASKKNKIVNCTIDQQKYNLIITPGPNEIYSLATQLHAKILDNEYNKISYYISDRDLLSMKKLLGYDMFTNEAFLGYMKKSIPQILYNILLINTIKLDPQEIKVLKNLAHDQDTDIPSKVISNYLQEKKILEFWGNKVDRYNIKISNLPVDKRIINVVKKLSPLLERKIIDAVPPDLLQKIKWEKI